MTVNNEEAGTMRHHIVYWRMAKRETDVDDTELALLREQERRGEVYIEFLDEMRLPGDGPPLWRMWREPVG
ncbi:MAG: hypothetical protein ACAH81_09990 [Actinomycetota bacterium]